MSRRALVAVGAALVVAAVAAVVLVNRPATKAACDAPFAEPIDPNSSQHLLPGAPEAVYLSDPPTSGAHSPGLYPTGAVATPIPRKEQVTLLEQGEVLVQYRSLSSRAVADLRAFVRKTAHVTIAPNPELTSPVVATAWLWKMNCRSVSDSALRDFVNAHQPAQPVSK